MKIHELQKQRAALKVEAEALIKKADDDSVELTAEDFKAVDKVQTDIAAIDQKIETAHKLEKMTAGFANDKDDAGIDKVFASPKSAKDKDQGGFNDIGEFANAVYNFATGGPSDDRLQAQAPTDAHQETGSSDGHMVPTQFRRDIWELVTEGDGFINMITTEDTISNNVSMLRDESTPWGNLGLQAFWGSELGNLTPSRLETDGDILKLQKVYVFAEASDELLEDAPRLTSRLTQGAADAINFKLDQGIFSGDGVGKPEGLLNSGALISVAKESGQSADTIVAANVLNMYSRQWNIRNSVWLANIDIFPQIAQMTIGDQPMFQPPTGMAGAPFGTLMGRPIQYNQQSEVLGDVGDLVLADMKGYYGIKKSGGVKFAESMHLFFDRDAQAFRWTFRFNGQTFMSQPVTPNKGTTKSHFVALAERA